MKTIEKLKRARAFSETYFKEVLITTLNEGVNRKEYLAIIELCSQYELDDFLLKLEVEEVDGEYMSHFGHDDWEGDPS